jgi:hypothetical protein
MTDGIGIFDVQDGQIGTLRNRCGRQRHGRGRAGEKDDQVLEHRGGALIDQLLGF